MGSYLAAKYYVLSPFRQDFTKVPIQVLYKLLPLIFFLQSHIYQEFLMAANFSFTSCKTLCRGVTKNAVVDDEEEEVLLLLPPERT
jgi:hypothetical protein